jgi:hypothetical protein
MTKWWRSVWPLSDFWKGFYYAMFWQLVCSIALSIWRDWGTL